MSSPAASTPAASPTAVAWPSASPLPMRVTSFERQMLLDDRDTHPMACHVQMRFSGQIDPTLFAESVAAVLPRHPFFDALITGSAHYGSAKWIPSNGVKPYIDVGPIGKPCLYPHNSFRIDLTKETGVRFWIRTGDDEVELKFQFHHACSDGVGCYRFLEDVFCVYDHKHRGQAGLPDLPPVDVARLKQRNRFGFGWTNRLLRLPLEAVGFFGGLYKLLCEFPEPIAAPKVPQSELESLEHVLDLPTLTLDESQMKGLRKVAKEVDASLNDLFIREMILASHAWNAQHDERSVKNRVRVVVPMNMRAPGDETLPACNVVGMVFIDRYPALHNTPQTMLSTIRRGMNLYKRTKLGLSWTYTLDFLGVIPGMVERLSLTHRAAQTTVVSNMGKVFDQVPLSRRDGKMVVGDMALEVVESAPPVRPYLRAVLSIVSYGKRMALSFNYDRTVWSPETASEFLACFSRQIEATLEGSREHVALMR